MNTTVEFINHASVLISTEKCQILSDPWYDGDVFNKGWSLLVEQSGDEVESLLNRVSHIWLSHEHPDHFSIKFFNTHIELLKKNNIRILFQKTRDQRVSNFLKSKGLEVIDLSFNRELQLSEDCRITCMKEGFYDSALLVVTKDLRILNLNDCEIVSEKRATEIKRHVGNIDVLLSQFSYAAWKGGKNNIEWRKDAAKKKIKTLKLQVQILRPKYLIPFASFVYFSNPRNFYLNDSINQPKDVFEALKHSISVVIMKPFDVFAGSWSELESQEANYYWTLKYASISPGDNTSCKVIPFEVLSVSFINYRTRIKNNNNLQLMKLVSLLSPIKAFEPVHFFLDDSKIFVKLDIFSDQLEQTSGACVSDLIMSSEQLNFILKNSFGFDTLTVNGCFEEGRAGGFVKATKTLAIENFNNLGFKFVWTQALNFNLIFIFLKKLFEVSKKLSI